MAKREALEVQEMVGLIADWTTIELAYWANLWTTGPTGLAFYLIGGF